ncbi:bifunctional cobalt-precorrin-7 (C(5))-methyltransferase/cobalt-precorrin-6B (C(15))-methyltransferase [Thiocystis violascens]|uniref:Precorrin-6y C5,15-methyltransferase (Decarboxylating), CbiE subunit,precorrin-6Y C5,15-methyltransferase (Decarboxylating), CbiT subunit n=1 Tax=Thiocystis violascens (strain ATCC 17096 / DSM 198 / 6111) TaxID=765911 RepID=I3Y9J0_THIV6|nr:bifunctional cobalt-precorrin-7 (C(5))-methyltransferase/cobalt-precorrin-6B (C(15))-methyltransferase [Thiocystis violascens]AFL73658.1 precorrin-6y C5,15-methyltransferase (decarboxylating), CbiE subunit,precorrin-6Y C5,15-methyltransferase (decarboxylating), CbiT subunit [Thiocystis violascens DSM 198]
MTAWLTIVGIGEDGLPGLGEEARRAVAEATVLFGGERHLALVPERAGQRRQTWPSPFGAAYDQLLALRGSPVCVLASGDPMFYGIGGSLAERIAPDEMRILPAPASVSLAAARMGWPVQETRIVPAHGRPLERVNLYLTDGARLLVLSADAHTPAQLATLLDARGFGDSRLSVFERLGGPAERRLDGLAADWTHPPGAALNLIAVACRAGPDALPWSRRCGLPDDAYAHDGQLTKRDIRAATLARLAPLPGERLWDVGAGCGSIGIEWMRAERGCRAIAIESDASRRALIERNRTRLGVPELDLVAGRAPEALEGLASPDAVFIGGGLTVAGVADRCWQALKPGGRLVANAVTVQSEAFLVGLRARIGGDLTRIAIAHASPLGRFDGWRPAMPVTLLTAVKPD